MNRVNRVNRVRGCIGCVGCAGVASARAHRVHRVHGLLALLILLVAAPMQAQRVFPGGPAFPGPDSAVVITLGTGTPVPNPDRSGPATAVGVEVHSRPSRASEISTVAQPATAQLLPALDM